MLTPLPDLRKCEAEGAAIAGHRGSPESAAVVLHHPTAYGQADAGSRVLLMGVQPLEHFKNTLQVLFKQEMQILKFFSF